ncbi:hypothetical protein H4219_006297, partial [Mycoemilia scoparia]
MPVISTPAGSQTTLATDMGPDDYFCGVCPNDSSRQCVLGRASAGGEDKVVIIQKCGAKQA